MEKNKTKKQLKPKNNQKKKKPTKGEKSQQEPDHYMHLLLRKCNIIRVMTNWNAWKRFTTTEKNQLGMDVYHLYTSY